jgi:phosphoribosylformylglycinamidine cyclo-ligase
MQSISIHAIAHITGGGLPGNIPRVLPDNTRAVINADSWSRPAIFDWLQQAGNIEDSEMYRTFNCGIGMVLVVAADDADKTIQVLTEQGESAVVIGKIESSQGSPEVEIR